jgi:hypothetical protein
MVKKRAAKTKTKETQETPIVEEATVVEPPKGRSVPKRAPRKVQRTEPPPSDSVIDLDGEDDLSLVPYVPLRFKAKGKKLLKPSVQTVAHPPVTRSSKRTTAQDPDGAGTTTRTNLFEKPSKLTTKLAEPHPPPTILSPDAEPTKTAKRVKKQKVPPDSTIIAEAIPSLAPVKAKVCAFVSFFELGLVLMHSQKVVKVPVSVKPTPPLPVISKQPRVVMPPPISKPSKRPVAPIPRPILEPSNPVSSTSHPGPSKLPRASTKPAVAISDDDEDPDEDDEEPDDEDGEEPDSESNNGDRSSDADRALDTDEEEYAKETRDLALDNEYQEEDSVTALVVPVTTGEFYLTLWHD